MKGRSSEHSAETLLSTFGTKVLHTVGDAKTATWASELVGRGREIFLSPTEKPGSGMGDMLFGDPGVTVSMSEQYQPKIQPSVFLSGGLRNGGPANDFMVDAVAINSQPYASGHNYLYFSVKQPRR